MFKARQMSPKLKGCAYSGYQTIKVGARKVVLMLFDFMIFPSGVGDNLKIISAVFFPLTIIFARK